MKKFWNWKNKIVQNQDETSEKQERILFLNGTIAEESWFDDDVTPKIFKEELLADSGDITIWINSPGGDCIAAAQIYNMLMEYKGQVTVKIDGLAASAASVIAMVRAKTPYAHIVEFGSKSYTLRAKNKKALTIPGGSALVLRKSAKIPARKGRPFIEPSFEAEEPKIVSSMKKVLNK